MFIPVAIVGKLECNLIKFVFAKVTGILLTAERKLEILVMEREIYSVT